jgi:hypothetical protein
MVICFSGAKIEHYVLNSKHFETHSAALRNTTQITDIQNNILKNPHARPRTTKNIFEKKRKINKYRIIFA